MYESQNRLMLLFHRSVEEKYLEEDIPNLSEIKGAKRPKLIELCEQLSLKRTGKLEVIRKRLLEYVEEKKEIEATKLPSLAEIRDANRNGLVGLCEKFGLKATGRAYILRTRLAEYVKHNGSEFRPPQLLYQGEGFFPIPRKGH